MKYYAGIGSRTTPSKVILEMRMIGDRLAALGYILRSGGAEGADSAFEHLVTDPFKKEILRPRDATPKARELASTIHPAWPMCSDYSKNLHARNCQIILGRDLDKPVQFVVCWTPEPVERGGTRTGIVLAQDRDIPVFNLFNTQRAYAFEKFCEELKSGPSRR
jgi:hypothetical protein